MNVNALVVGAGGIGCELLKNLALSDYDKITVIDLDTIDVSNLNRQFLFRKKHVGQSKAEIASSSIRAFNPDINIISHHKSIFSQTFSTDFFASFDIVFNALDNLAARRHVNRMCIAAKRPLIESGTAGYLGQVEPLLPTVHLDTNDSLRTACFECQDRGNNKRSYPACTIRNTPSEPIHCVIWAKHLFTHLFGQPEDDDEDVTPDLNDPDLKKASEPENGHSASKNETTKNIWLWARQCASKAPSPLADPSLDETVAWRLWHDDILTLIGMRALWEGRKDRKEPVPCSSAHFAKSRESTVSTSGNGSLRDQRVGEIPDWLQLYLDSSRRLRARAGITDDGAGSKEPLSWDKDDADAMDFVAAAAALRCALFHVPGNDASTIFQLKSLAGNIVPAIATTNAVVAAVMVLQADKVLRGQERGLRNVYLRRVTAGNRSQLMVPVAVPAPNPSCVACSRSDPEYTLLVRDLHHLTLKQLRSDILISKLGMIAPDVEHSQRNAILLSSDDDDQEEEVLLKSLAEFSLSTGARLHVDDFHQVFAINLVLRETGAQSVRDCLETLVSASGDAADLVGEDALPEDASWAIVRTRSGHGPTAGLKRASEPPRLAAPGPSKRARLENESVGHVDASSDEELVMLD